MGIPGLRAAPAGHRERAARALGSSARSHRPRRRRRALCEPPALHSRGVVVIKSVSDASQKEAPVTQASLITDEMRAAIGRESEPVTYEVDRTGCRQLARAAGYSDPAYFDPGAARGRGH